MNSAVVLVDADSLVFASAVTSDTLEEGVSKLNSSFYDILDRIDSEYGIQALRVYNGVKGTNFRYEIYPEYKANRKNNPVPELLKPLQSYLKSEWDSIQAENEEVDDIVAREAIKYKNQGENVIIVSIDKDYLQVPVTLYNYRRREFYKISKKDSLINLSKQMIVGDSVDNIKGVKGRGKVYAERLFEGDLSDFGIFRRVYAEYLIKYGSEAKSEFIKNYKLLKIGGYV